ncbi:hypothetical protein [Trujillonella endophytica]|uniref:ABM domain-containing protein n=1 Tax=Trujillonella endophytica TaxID=673521 RepID=A0A1H8T0Z2_9ACTN|nr:hypothetical protein [Trujillella endophytica]SEO84621.1 hypothetical protein SAMN05660991_01986 [Trujillella endophytica]
MYARVTVLEIDTTRVSVDAALETYLEKALPELRKQNGYEGIYMLSTPEGRGLVMTLWSTAEAADVSSPVGFYADVLSEFVTVFKAPPGRECYQVRFADVPAPTGA